MLRDSRVGREYKRKGFGKKVFPRRVRRVRAVRKELAKEIGRLAVDQNGRIHVHI